MLPLLFVIGFFCICLAVKREKFKTCEQSGFCHRLYGMSLPRDRYMLVENTLTCSEAVLRLVLFDRYFEKNYVFLAIALTDNRFRMKMVEGTPRFKRVDLFQDLWKNLQPEPEADPSVPVEKINSSACRFTFKTGYTALIVADSMRISISDASGLEFLTFNDQHSLLMEPHITSTSGPDESKRMQAESGEAERPMETGNHVPPEYFDGHTDRLPHGYQAVSFDATFHSFRFVYGIPEHADTFALNTSNSLYRLFNLDVFEYELYNGMALYGSVPYLVAANTEKTVGLLFLNPSEMWVSLNKAKSNPLLSIFGKKQQDTSIRTRWVAEAGIFDVILMLGSKPSEMSYQYALTTGFPSMPPLFALGYHQCRWNYIDEEDVHAVDEGFDTHRIPYDVIWLDIDHTPHRSYFRFDEKKFPHFHQMILNISAKGRKMVTVVDPHVKKQKGYYVYDEAMEREYAIRTLENDTYVGWCWPGNSIYPNYIDPNVRKWYSGLFHTDKYVGSTVDLHTWVDMNEPSVFNGPEVTTPKDAKHGEFEDREIHNIYGSMCAEAAYSGGLVRSENSQRPFLLVRSFFAGSQKYGAVWTGDNDASWAHLRITVPMLLSLNIAGITFSGADVAGFFGNPDEELFYRWYQAASMQPFFRGHAHIDTIRREPWSYGSTTTELVRQQIIRRYKYLPYIYTVFHDASRYGTPVMRPLWYEFPSDPNTFEIEDSYLLGSSLLIKPVVEPNAKFISVYFPSSPNGKTFWFGLFDNNEYSSGEMQKIPLPSASELPMFQRSGTIVPTWQRLRRASSKMTNDPITLSIVVDSAGHASGSFYIDDSVSFEFKNGSFAVFNFSYSDGILSGGSSGRYDSGIWLERVIIHGLRTPYTTAFITYKGFKTGLYVYKHGNTLTVRKPGNKLADGFILHLVR